MKRLSSHEMTKPTEVMKATRKCTEEIISKVLIFLAETV